MAIVSSKGCRTGRLLFFPEFSSAAAGDFRALGFVTQAAAFHQMEQLFAQILGVVAGALEGLRHKQQVGAVVATSIFALQMPAKHSMADVVNLRVGFHYPVG